MQQMIGTEILQAELARASYEDTKVQTSLVPETFLTPTFGYTSFQI